MESKSLWMFLLPIVIFTFLPYFLLSQDPGANNIKLVYDACSNTLKLTAPDGSNRKGLFIRHNEVLSFEIQNPNTLMYNYSLNQSLESFHVDFSEINEVLGKGSGKVGFIPDVETCDDKITALLNAQADLNLQKKLYASMECIDKDEVLTYIQMEWLNIGGYFIGLTFENMVKDILSVFMNANCKQTAHLEMYLEFSVDSTVIGLKDSFKDRIELIQKDFSDLYMLCQTQYITSMPVHTSGQNIDVVRYTLQKEPIDKNLQTGKPFEATYDVEVRGGYKIDVSAGLFLTGLVDEKYYLKDSEKDSLKTIMAEDKDMFSISVGSTVNLDWRLGCYVNGGLSVGVAVPFTNESLVPQLMAGLNLLAGKEWRLGVIGGVVYGPTSVLKKGYEEGKSYAFSDNTVPMTDISKVSYFFGIVYNLGSEKILGKE